MPSWPASSPIVGLISDQTSGVVGLRGDRQCDASAPDVSLTVTSDRILAAQREISNIRLVASGKADLASPAADIALTGTVGGEALNGKATLSTADGQRQVNGLTLSLGQNRIAGDLLLDQNFLPLGTVNFELPNVGPLAALALEKVDGDLNGSIRFHNADGKPQLAIDARTTAITRGDVSARDVTIAATVADYASAPAIAGKITAATVTSGATIVSGIDVALTRDGVWTGFDGRATVSGIPANAKGRVQLSGGRTVVELASGEATVQGIKAAIARASTIQIVDGVTTLDRLALKSAAAPLS